MKSESAFKLTRPSTVASDEQFFFKIGFLNTNSLLPHADCVVSDDYLTTSHIICLAETWLTPADTNPDIPNHFHVRCDLAVTATEHRHGGLLMFIHFDFLLLKQLHVPNTNVHHLSVLISPRWNPDVRICVVCLYRNPTSTVQDFLPQLERLLIGLPLQAVQTFICGDFNIDIQSDKYGVKQLLHLMKYYGLRQYVEIPTHRRGGLLDHMYITRRNADVQMDINPVYYSDHLHVSMAVPFPNLHT